MKTLYEKTIEQIEDTYAKSLLTAKALKQDMDRLERAVPVAEQYFGSTSTYCTIHDHYHELQIYPAALVLVVYQGSDDDLLKLLIDVAPVLVPDGEIVVKLDERSDYFNSISIAGRTGNKFYVNLNSKEFPKEWVKATVDRYLQITGQKPRVIGFDLAKPEATEVAA